MAENINEKYDKMLELADSVQQQDSTKLTDDQIDQVIVSLDKVPQSENTKKYNEIIHGDNDPQEGFSQTESVVINNKNGLPVYGADLTGSSNVNIDTDSSLDELIGLNDVEPMKVSDTVVTTDAVQSSILSIYPQMKLDDETLNELVDIATRYKNGEKISYYQVMPQKVKDSINLLLGTIAPSMGSYSKEGRNFAAKEMLDAIIDTAYMDTSYKDLNTATKVTLADLNNQSVEALSDFFKMQREQFEVNYPKQAKAYEDALAKGEIKEEDKEKIKKSISVLNSVSHNFIQAYMYEDMMEQYRAGKLKVKSIQIEKIKRTCDEFNYKYQNHVNAIDDIRFIIPILDRKIDKDIDIKTIKKFVCIFINYTKNMTPDNMGDHVFMYYFVKNIESLECYNHSNEEEEKFYGDLLQRINSICKEIA